MLKKITIGIINTQLRKSEIINPVFALAMALKNAAVTIFTPAKIRPIKYICNPVVASKERVELASLLNAETMAIKLKYVTKYIINANKTTDIIAYFSGFIIKT